MLQERSFFFVPWEAPPTFGEIIYYFRFIFIAKLGYDFTYIYTIYIHIQCKPLLCKLQGGLEQDHELHSIWFASTPH